MSRPNACRCNCLYRVTALVVVNYPNADTVDPFVRSMQDILGKGGPRWDLVVQADRPPLPERGNTPLLEEFSKAATKWDISLAAESSAWPSVAGLVPEDTPCLCGVGPVARHLRTPQESVQRISLIQRTLLLGEVLANRLDR